MSEDATNKLCEILGDKAAAKLRFTLDQDAQNFTRAIGLSGTSMTILMVAKASACQPIPATEGERTEKVELRLSSRDMIDAIVDALVKHREQGHRDKAVIEFMKDVASFRSRVNELEQYAEELGIDNES